MSFAEVMLRIGCALVGWLLVYSHALLLAVVPRADCSDGLWRASLVFALLALVASRLIVVGRPWRSTLRWLAAPAAALWVIGVPVVVGLLAPVAVGGAALCDALAGVAEPERAAAWQRAWPPLQLLALALCAHAAITLWRGGPEPARAPR